MEALRIVLFVVQQAVEPDDRDVAVGCEEVADVGGHVVQIGGPGWAVGLAKPVLSNWFARVSVPRMVHIRR